MARNKTFTRDVPFRTKYDPLPEYPEPPKPETKPISRTFDFMCRLKEAIKERNYDEIDRLRIEINVTEDPEIKELLLTIWTNTWRNEDENA